ncbi:LpxL/LpxP family acyltransferase, partial [Legionella pneumophila]
KEQAIYQNTLRYNQMLEKLILEYPEQWWWVHRRWKL